MPREYLIFADVEPQGTQRSVVVLVDLSPERANRLLDLRVPFVKHPEHPVARPHEFSYHWYDFLVIERGDFLQTEGFIDYEVVDSQMVRVGQRHHFTFETEVPRVVVREEHLLFKAYLRRSGECVSIPLNWPIVEKLAGLPCISH